MALTVATVGVLWLSAVPASADAIDSVCTFSKSGTTWTLSADCSTIHPLTVPNGITIDGANHTISASNPPPTPTANTYTGAVVTNAAGATSMNIENLTITGPAAGFPITIPAPGCNSPFPGLFGIFFNDAGGSVNNVKVLNIFQTRTPGSPACVVGHAIRADGVTAPRTVTITNTRASNYQRGGMFASGSVTVNVSASTFGPGSSVPFSIAQNAVQWSNGPTNSNGIGASGSITDSTIVGTNFLSTGPVDPLSSASTAILAFGAHDVTVDHNTITGGADLGVSVTAGSANTVISFNAINRPDPPDPDSYGIGVAEDTDLVVTTRLICNTFSGWKTDIDPAAEVQEPCPPPTTTTTTPVAAAAVTSTTAPVAATAELPRTGNNGGIVLLGTALLLAGGALVARTRRRL